ncbi:type I restriction endonuclease subunit M, partial [Oceanidesulfovibrio indonesiensis]
RDYRDGKNQNFLRDEDLEKVLATAKAREKVDKYAYLASFDEIKENDFNLNIPRYVDTFEEEEEIDLVAVLQERKALKSDLEQLEAKMEGYLKELGFMEGDNG